MIAMRGFSDEEGSLHTKLADFHVDSYVLVVKAIGIEIDPAYRFVICRLRRP